MKKIIVWGIVIAAVAAGGVISLMHRGSSSGDADDQKPVAADEAGGSRLSHDDQGNAVIKLDDKTVKEAGIVATNPEVGNWSQEVKGFGQVIDPSPLVDLVNELAGAESAAAVSSRELERQKTLVAETNASARAYENAEAVAQHDQLAVQSARGRLVLGWGRALAGREDLASLAQQLIARQAALIRVELAGSENLAATPAGARLVTLSGATADAKLLGASPTVDPENQGQGFIFFMETNSISLAPGQTLTAWLEMPGEPISGIIIPRDAVVRAEGGGWVYVAGNDGQTFTRRPIPTDRPTDGGWFVAGSIKAEDHIVVAGAQTLLSEELKAALTPD